MSALKNMINNPNPKQKTSILNTQVSLNTNTNTNTNTTSLIDKIRLGAGDKKDTINNKLDEYKKM